MVEEQKLFVRKTSKLQEMLDALQKHQVAMSTANYLQALKEKTKTISASVKRDGASNTGGKFEWVDSVLIKVLKISKITKIKISKYFEKFKNFPIGTLVYSNHFYS